MGCTGMLLAESLGCGRREVDLLFFLFVRLCCYVVSNPRLADICLFSTVILSGMISTSPGLHVEGCHHIIMRVSCFDSTSCKFEVAGD